MKITSAALLFLLLLQAGPGFAQGTYGQEFISPLTVPDTLTGREINLTAREGVHEFFTGSQTNTNGINGDYLGPAILMRKGDSIRINVANEMNTHTTMHWHGFHVPARHDGGPRTIIQPGTVWSPEFKIFDQAATYWYHPHPHGLTTQQVTLGMMGLIIVRDSVEDMLALPRDYGVDDIPLVIQSKCFLPISRQIDPLGSETHFVVNSTVYPYVELPRQVVRLRILNGSNLRVINVGFSDNRTFYQIASDGGLLPEPLPMKRIKLSTGERAELLVDLSDLGDQPVYLTNYALELPQGTPGTLFTAAPSILDIQNKRFLEIRGIEATENAISDIPGTLPQTYTPFDENEAVVTRNFNMEVDMLQLITSGFIKGFSFDNQLFDHMVVNHTARIGDTEIWDIYNNTPFSHPFHIHDQQFYILDRNGEPPPPNERGRKDVVLVNRFERVRIIARFEDFSDDYHTYMYHCHILSHEDEGMMGQFLVLDTAKVITSLSEYSSENSISIYPNPVTEHVIISSTGHGPALGIIRILSLDGRICHETTFQKDNPIPVGFLDSGTYFIQLLDERKDWIICGKLIKI